MIQKGLRQLMGRRDVLRAAFGSAAGLVGAAIVEQTASGQTGDSSRSAGHDASMSGMAAGTGSSDHDADMDHGSNMMVGEVDHVKNGFDPLQMLVDWDYGKVSTLPDGRTLREYEIVAFDRQIEIAPGIFFNAWTYNGRVPGPSIRCTEGDLIRIHFVNAGSHPHTIHFHGFHNAEMDGIPGVGAGNIDPGQETTYEFEAAPYGCHLYHCHVLPLKRHLHKGLYGAFVVDPKGGRPPAREFVMVMNGFDTNFDGENEVYACNTVGFEYTRRPIPMKAGELVRIYLVNLTEFDPINSIHLHATFFDYYDHGTTLTPTQRIVDTVMQCQAQRGILEFTHRWPGIYMFHAHQAELTELGWMGMFNVATEMDFPAALTKVGLDEEWDRKSMSGSTVAYTQNPLHLLEQAK